MNFWRKWHRWIGTIAGIFLLIIGATGVLLQIDELGHFSERAAPPPRAATPPLDVVALAARVEALSGGRKIEMLRLESHKKQPSAIVRFSGQKKVVQIDLATGAQKPSSEIPTSPRSKLAQLRLLILEFHTLGIAGVGGKVTAWFAGVMMVILTGSGLWMWWTMRRERVRRAAKDTLFWK